MFFIYSRCKFLIQYMICRYLLPFCSCLFTCLIVSLEAQNFLILMVSAFFFATLFFNWRIIAYRLLLFSVRHQQESYRGTPMSPPSRACLPTPFPPRPSRLSQSPCFESAETCSRFPLAVCFTYGSSHRTLHASPLLLPSPRAHRSVLHDCFADTFISTISLDCT